MTPEEITALRLDVLVKMRQHVQADDRLRLAFDTRWFDGARQEIIRAEGRPDFKMGKFTAFIGFRTDIWLTGTSTFLTELSEDLRVIGHMAGRNLKQKLRAIAGDADDYVSMVFEIKVVALFARAGCLVEYEPKTAGGRPEAFVELSGELVLVEARATRDDSFSPARIGAHIGSASAKLFGKIQEKYRQLRFENGASVLFLALNQHLRDGAAVAQALNFVAEDPNGSHVSAIVVAEDFRTLGLRLWVNSKATTPLSPGAEDALRNLIKQ